MQSSLTNWLKLEDEFSTRQRLRSSLLEWATEVLRPHGQAPALHHRYLLDALGDVTRGSVDRLMVLMPPGSAKSTYASVLFPAWWFAQHPGSSVIAVSHTHGLAETFSRRVRELMLARQGQLGISLNRSERSAAHWRLASGGEYIAAGIRGAITGRRADLIIIDDPIKSLVEAEGQLHREQIWQWYRSDLTTRLKPNGRIILIMTRWHEDDLGGTLLANHAADWRVIRLPALAESDDPLGRAIGEPLWPEWEDTTALLRKRELVGERTWASLFQQSPRPISGGVFKVSALSMLDNLSTGRQDQVVRAWDLAATLAAPGTDPDWTVGIKLHKDSEQRFTILDVVRLRGTPRQVEDAIVSTARIDGVGVAIGLPEDPGQAGKSQVAYLAGRLAGYRLLTSRESGSKLVRALPVASQMEAGNVAMIRANWNHILIEELREFPGGRKDDQVDALVRAFTTQMRIGTPTRQSMIPFLAR